MLSPASQFRLLAKLARNLPSYDSPLERALLVFGYAALVGRIHETSIIGLLEYADVDRDEDVILSMLNYYVKTGFIEIIDERKGLCKAMRSMASFEVDPDDDIMVLTKTQIEKMRKEIDG